MHFFRVIEKQPQRKLKACREAAFYSTMLLMLKHTLTTLDSGLKVLQIPIDSVKSATVLLLCNTGSRYEVAHNFGIAHFLEHMVFKGTNKFPTAQSLAEAVDNVGADFNAFTGKEYTGYYVKAASEHLELALDVVSDMLMTPQLRQEDIDREKGVIVEEMNMYADMPARYIGDLFEQMLFAGSGLEHNIIGTKETVINATTADFQRFLQQWYGLENMVLIVAGDASVVGGGALLGQAEKAFGKGAAAPRQQHQEVLPLLSTQPISTQQLLVHHKTTEQAHFILGFPGVKRTDPDKYAISVLSTIVGGNMSSRLFSEIREKRGLCYYIHSDSDHYHDTGFFGAAAGVDPQRVDEAVTVTMEELTALSGKKPITAAELVKAKDYVAGKMVLGLEDSESVAQFFGMRQLLYGEIESPEQVITEIRNVTLGDLERVIARLIKPDQVRFGIIGPYEDEDRFKKLLAL